MDSQPKLTNEGTTASEPDSVLSSILFTLKTLQLQNKKLTKYQEASYQWHLQGWNFEPIEDKNLLQTTRDSFSSSETTEAPFHFSNPMPELNRTFHQYVLSFKDSPTSIDLEKALEEVSVEQFKELKDESAEFVFSIVTKWLRNSSSRKRDIGFAWVLELAKNFTHLFTKKENRFYVRTCYEDLQNSAVNASADELEYVKIFLQKCM